MSRLIVVGAQWGDEGKGKVVDLLSERFDIVARYQGFAQGRRRNQEDGLIRHADEIDVPDDLKGLDLLIVAPPLGKSLGGSRKQYRQKRNRPERSCKRP